MLIVATKAKRTLDDVAEATDIAMKQIEAVMKKAGLNAAGPRMTITTNWGEEDYAFSVAHPGRLRRRSRWTSSSTRSRRRRRRRARRAMKTRTQTFKPGDKDNDGMLVLDDNVRAALWYQGKALVTEYTGNPAQLPLLRLMEKAYAETHGYPYAEMGDGPLLGRARPRRRMRPKTSSRSRCICRSRRSKYAFQRENGRLRPSVFFG